MSKKDTTEEVAVVAPEATLTLQDLTLVANIVDLAVQRGAFKGAEAETVGKQFNKLVEIIKAIAPAEDEVDAEETATE
jgi:hypothetical protein